MLIRGAGVRSPYRNNFPDRLEKANPEFSAWLSKHGISDDFEGRQAVLAYEQGDVEGVWVYEKFAHAIYSECTLVSERFRRRGVATRLWERVLRGTPAYTVVRVSIGSSEGLLLARSLSRKYGSLIWRIYV